MELLKSEALADTSDYGYKFKEHEETMKKIEEVTKLVLKCRKGDNKLGAQDLKDKLGDKLGDKLSMASLIVSFANVCSEAKGLLSKMHGHNFELRGKVADLSSSAMKKMADEMRGNQSSIMTEIDEVKKQVVSTNEGTGKKTFADIVGNANTALVVSMKQAIKEIEKEDERAKNVIIYGLDIDPSCPREKQGEQVIALARHCLTEITGKIVNCELIGSEDEGVVDLKILGKIGGSGRAPPVLVTMESSYKAGLVIKQASRLSVVCHFRRVYVTPDLSKEDREKRKKLSEDLKENIENFPKEHWVIRRGAITSKGKFTPRERLDSTDEGKELDRSFNY